MYSLCVKHLVENVRIEKLLFFSRLRPGQIGQFAYSEKSILGIHFVRTEERIAS